MNAVMTAVKDSQLATTASAVPFGSTLSTAQGSTTTEHPSPLPPSPSQPSQRRTGNYIPPDFMAPPFVGSSCDLFEEPIYGELSEEMDLDVVDLFIIATDVGLAARKMGLRLAEGDGDPLLDEAEVEEIRLTSFGAAWVLITGAWSWEEVLRDPLLLPTIKRNLRVAMNWDRRLYVSCKVMLDLGFKDEFLHSYKFRE
jgi:hypothetical protein